MKRRTINVFSLSFIDCIACGLGAIILLFLIVNARSATYRSEVTKNLHGEVDRLKKEVLEGKKDLVEIRNTLEKTVEELTRAQGLSRRVIKTLEEKKTELATYEDDTLASKEHINRLKADLKSMEEERKRLKAAGQSDDDYGSRLRRFPGEGDRQYLTGLKMGGERIFILVDASASMLDDTVVGIIRRRNLTDKEKVGSPKWRHAVSSIDWLVTQLPPTSKFQVYAFNETAWPLLEGTKGKWLDAGKVEHLNGVVDSLRREVPRGGTSLVNPFTAIRGMIPPPDNIFLLTDSLPTMGSNRPRKKTVSGEKRLSLLLEAVEALPPRVPVNIILYSMEGDPVAASAYWRLAAQTRGSFFCPSRDWP
jgi:hypothetical protein